MEVFAVFIFCLSIVIILIKSGELKNNKQEVKRTESFNEEKKEILNHIEDISSSNKKSEGFSKNKDFGFKIDLVQMLEETSGDDFDDYKKTKTKKSIDNSSKIHSFKKEIIKQLDFTVVKVENDKLRTNFKLLITNNSDISIKTIYFDIKFYDEDNNLINVENKRVHYVDPGEEIVKIIHIIPCIDDFEKYSIKISNVDV